MHALSKWRNDLLNFGPWNHFDSAAADIHGRTRDTESNASKAINTHMHNEFLTLHAPADWST